MGLHDVGGVAEQDGALSVPSGKVGEVIVAEALRVGRGVENLGNGREPKGSVGVRWLGQTRKEPRLTKNRAFS